jgi:hypothetical protein
MQSDEASRSTLDPIDRCSEILFGLIMAVTIVGSISIINPPDTGVRSVLAAALGCNIAWGLVDAVMYVVRTFVERTRARTLARRITEADAGAALGLIRDALPEGVAAVTGPTELESMRQKLLAMSGPQRPVFDRHDFGAALRIFLLVVLATFPVVVPFLLTDDLAKALQLSRIVTLLMLFATGWALGRHAGYAHPVRTGLFAAAFGVALIATVMALGG